MRKNRTYKAIGNLDNAIEIGVPELKGACSFILKGVTTLVLAATVVLAAYAFTDGFNKASKGLVEENTTCAAGTYISDDCLTPTGVTAGTYTNLASVTVDDQGRVTDITVAAPTTAPAPLALQVPSIAVYVDSSSGSDANDGLTMGAPKATLQNATSVLETVVADLCRIVILSYVDLGTDPVIDFFPTSNACKEIQVEGVRTNIVQDTIQSLTTYNTEGRNWYEVNGTTGGYGLNTYECAFMRDLNTSLTWAVESNTDNSVKPAMGRFSTVSNGNIIELYNVSSELRWTGRFQVDARIGIDFKDIVMAPQTSESSFRAETVSTTTLSGVILRLFTHSGSEGPFSGNDLQIHGALIKPASAAVSVGWCADMTSVLFLQGTSYTLQVACPSLLLNYVGVLTTAPTFSLIVPSGVQASIQSTGLFVNRVLVISAVGEFTLKDSTLIQLDSFGACDILTDFTDISVGIMRLTGGPRMVSATRLRVLQIIMNQAELSIGVVGSLASPTQTIGPIIADFMSTVRINTATGVIGGTNNIPWLSLSRLSRAVFNNAIVLMTNSTANTIPLIQVNPGSSVYGAGSGLDNAAFPGTVIKCCDNAISDWSTPTNDLTNNCFCS